MPRATARAASLRATEIAREAGDCGTPDARALDGRWLAVQLRVARGGRSGSGNEKGLI
jgi:hypothetical protein